MDKTLNLDNLGKRICIIGRSCSGKSTLADTLAAHLQLPLLHLDQIAFIPHTNWQRCPDEDFIKAHEAFLNAHDEWVIEGNYSITMEERLKRATSVIFADYARESYLWHYIKRCVQSCFAPHSRIGAMQGAKAEFNWDMVRFVWEQYPKNSHKYYNILDEFCADKPVLIVKNFKEMRDLYKQLGLNYKKM
jgi:adenylate kinase family enzyme